MEIQYLLKGLLLGISVSAPLGPIGVLCIQKTINKGRFAGFISGTGAVFADTLYAIIAGFGFTFVSNFLDDQQFGLRFIGGLALIIFGINIFMSHPAKIRRKKDYKKNNHARSFFSVFLLTLSNPITVLFFGAAFAGLGLTTEKSDRHSVLLLVIGVFFGAILWWFMLSFIVDQFRSRINIREILLINKITGTLITLLGMAAMGSLLFLN